MKCVIFAGCITHIGHVYGMIISFKKFLLITSAVLLPVCAQAQDSVVVEPDNKVEAEKKDKAEKKTDFIRVVEDEKAVRLQTSVTRYVKEGVNVDLIGAVHVADKQYFTDLNELFTKSEVLLFELIGGEQIKAGVQLKKGKQENLEFSLLGAMYEQMQKRLDLTGQKEHIDYFKENFVHADLTIEEFQTLQKEKKESILSFALKNANSTQKAINERKKSGEKVKQASSLQMLRALITGNTDLLKYNLVFNLGNGDDQIAAFAGESVIIGDRNIKCLDVMNAQIKEGKKNIGIFYGAAHFPDMEDRMLKEGFKKTNQFWMTAWNIDKKKAGKK